MSDTPASDAAWREYRVPHLLRCGRCDWSHVPETLNDYTKALRRHARECPAGRHLIGREEVYADEFDDEDVRDVASLLLEHWDVLGVAEMDAAPETEYRHESLDVLRLLAQRADVDSLAAYLSSRAHELSQVQDAARDAVAARAVHEWMRQPS